MLVSNNQIARLEPDNMKTESTDQQSTDSQSENSRDNIDDASRNSNEETSLTEREQSAEATITSTRNKKRAERFGEVIPSNLLKKGGRM